ncbi:MAG: hypothetical protein A3G87_09170 [Omnitrophica bacterium RIFCSPLOWO2_12_FULL_50_11]|nr:MAG: hypothetical protein A3G87_09170 [Omnitrophica bacterium RIFCSPLOWO2_12_FULL_50_11]
MSAILIRGLSPAVRRQLKKLASGENLSLNQAVIQLLKTALEIKEEKQVEECRRREVFERVDKLRAELHARYGTFDDSAKLIRELRDRRYK